MNLASVNYYFGGKEGLYAATLKELAGRRLKAGASSTVRGEGAEDRLYAAVHAILATFVDGRGDAQLGRLLAHESMDPTPYFEALVGDVLSPEVERLRTVISQLSGGALAADVLERAASSVLGQCLFYLFARGAVARLFPAMTEGPERIDALARHITRFSIGGVAACRAG